MSQQNQSTRQSGKAAPGQQIFLRHDYYKNGMEKMTKVAIFSSAATAITIIAAAMALVFKPAPQNYAITPTGQIVPLTPMSEGVGNDALLSFASNAMITAFSLDFDHAEDQVRTAGSYFTESGYRAYVQAITPIIKTIKDHKLVSSIGVIHPPVIVNSGVVNGVKQYVIQAVISIALDGQNEHVPSEKWVVQMVVERVPQNRYPLGVAIRQFVVTNSNQQ